MSYSRQRRMPWTMPPGISLKSIYNGRLLNITNPILINIGTSDAQRTIHEALMERLL